MFSGVSSSQLQQSSLELTVWDQAIFGMNDRLLGGARLGSSKSVHFLWICVSQEFISESHRFMSLERVPARILISTVETIHLALKLPYPVTMGSPKSRSNSVAEP